MNEYIVVVKSDWARIELSSTVSAISKDVAIKSAIEYAKRYESDPSEWEVVSCKEKCKKSTS